MKENQLQRKSKYYTTGYKGKNSSEAPFYLRSLLFDGRKGELTQDLIEGFNKWLEQKEISSNYRLLQNDIKKVPNKIVIINASSDDLPTSYETKRIFSDRTKKENWDIDFVVVNKRKDLLKEIGVNDVSDLLLVSQCVKKQVYNEKLARELKGRGIVVVPGELTAPGSIFSDKARTYNLLSQDREKMVATYKKIDVERSSVKEVVEKMLDTVDLWETKMGRKKFFIKPIEGGGGLGGFRVIKSEKKYILPDLSKVTGSTENISPSYIEIDLHNDKRIKELFWIYKLFNQSERLRSNYIDVNIKGVNHQDKFVNFKKYLKESKHKQDLIYQDIKITREEAEKKLIEAITKFEKKFNTRYIPLVNEHIDFGTWGLRAHYRFTSSGPKLETIYSRIFQLAFTPEGVGYVGADNISNKQTGELEIERLDPINKVMLQALGGKERLYKILYKGAETVTKLVDLQRGESKFRVPFRIQLDLATVAGLIGEVNADTARGLCLASPWDLFLKNTSEWFIDSIKYYSWRCKNANI